MTSQSVKEFLSDSYQLVGSSMPNIPLQGSDQTQGLRFLNQFISSLSGTALMITVAKEVSYNLSVNQGIVTFADPSYTPAADVQVGRLANLQNAWLVLDNVTYPIKDESRNVFYSSYKYNPQVGLPLYCIIQNQIDVTSMQLFPAASQLYQLFVYGKFELLELTLNDSMSIIPKYLKRWLSFATAKELSFYKGRTEAWTDKLERELIKAEKDMQSVSSINLTIQSDHDTGLNGAYRVRAGV